MSSFWGLQGDSDEDTFEDNHDTSFFRQASNQTALKTTEELLEMLGSARQPIGCSVQQIDKIIDHLTDKWLDDNDNDTNYFQICCRSANIEFDPSNPPTPLVVEEIFDNLFIVLYELVKLCESTKEEDTNETMLSTNTQIGIERRDVMGQIFDVVTAAKQVLLYTSSFANSRSSNLYKKLTLEQRFLNCMNVDKQKHQIVEEYVLNSMAKKGLRFHIESVYAPILNEEGLHTHAWKEDRTIREYIAETITIESCYSVYMAYTASGAYNLGPKLAEFFKSYSKQFRLPKLEPRRDLISYKNVLLDLEQMAVYPLKDKKKWQSICDAAKKRILKKGDQRANDYLPPTDKDATLRYYDVDYPYADLLNDAESVDDIDEDAIPTPTLDKIFNHQRLTSHTQKCMHIMFGRLHYETGRHDDWQFAPMIIGIAQSGKSTIINYLSGYFHENSIFVYGANAQKEFGFDGAQHSHIVLVYETDESMYQHQKTFQSAISGERTAINIKNGTNINIIFKSQIFIVGNKPIKWRDESGSASRRLGFVRFGCAVFDQDEMMKYKLEEERVHAVTKAML